MCGNRESLAGQSMWNSLESFYTSDEWREFRRRVILSRGLVCEHCGEDIAQAHEAICHHITHLTNENVNDYDISLNESNIMLVHHKCHNIIHKRFGTYTRHIYLVYGAPGSGKTTFVRESAGPNDIIIDMDSIYQMISVNSRYDKPQTLSTVAFGVRDALLDMVKVRRGKWSSAYIIGGFPRVGERERLCQMYGAEEIYIECDKNICLERVSDREGWSEFVERWFDEFTESPRS